MQKGTYLAYKHTLTYNINTSTTVHITYNAWCSSVYVSASQFKDRGLKSLYNFLATPLNRGVLLCCSGPGVIFRNETAFKLIFNYLFCHTVGGQNGPQSTFFSHF